MNSKSWQKANQYCIQKSSSHTHKITKLYYKISIATIKLCNEKKINRVIGGTLTNSTWHRSDNPKSVHLREKKSRPCWAPGATAATPLGGGGSTWPPVEPRGPIAGPIPTAAIVAAGRVPARHLHHNGRNNKQHEHNTVWEPLARAALLAGEEHIRIRFYMHSSYARIRQIWRRLIKTSGKFLTRIFKVGDGFFFFSPDKGTLTRNDAKDGHLRRKLDTFIKKKNTDLRKKKCDWSDRARPLPRAQ